MNRHIGSWGSVVATEKSSSGNSWIRKTFNGLGFLVTTVAAILSVYYAFLQQSRTNLTLTVSEPQSIFDNRSGQASDVEVRIAGNLVQSAFVSRLSFVNSASFPITKTMVEAPLQIRFDQIPLFVRPVSSQPSNIDYNIKIVDRVVTVEHELINPSDIIEFDVFFESEPDPSSTKCSIRASNVSRCDVSRLSTQDRTFYAVPFAGTTAEIVVVWASIAFSLVYVLIYIIVLVFAAVSLRYRYRISKSGSLAEFIVRSGLSKRTEAIAGRRVRDVNGVVSMFTTEELQAVGDLTLLAVSNDGFAIENAATRAKLYDLMFDQYTAVLSGVPGFTAPRRNSSGTYQSAVLLNTDYLNRLRAANKDVGSILSVVTVMAAPLVPAISVNLGLLDIFT
jgi:hypothetical protein